MKKAPNLVVTLGLLFLCTASAFCQKPDFTQLAVTPKTKLTLPLDYKILRPRLTYPEWDDDFNKFYASLTPALKHTQATLSFPENGVVTTVTPNSIIPHAQLDTNTIIGDAQKITGVWRMLVFRAVRYNDSGYISPQKTGYYRLPDTLLADRSDDEAFAVVTDNNFQMYVREPGKKAFKKKMSSKYKVENNRYLMLYKWSKSAAGVSQIGFDEQGHLLMYYPKVVEKVKKGEYISYYAIVDQYVFEKVNP